MTIASYSYTPYIWPMLVSAIFFTLLGIYAWRHRGVPGALPFAIMMIFPVFWSVGAAMVLAANNPETKIFWFKFLNIFKLPTATAEICFVLHYCGLGRFLTRRNIILLSLPAIFALFFVLTNNIFHLMWLDLQYDVGIHPVRSAPTSLLFVYALILFLVEIIILIRFFIRSPQHRWPVALILSASFISHAVLIIDYLLVNPFAPMDPVILSWNVGATIYALALFVFRIFDPIPLARQKAITQMQDGMLVLDNGYSIVYLNPAVEKILGLSSTQLKGKQFNNVLSASVKGSDWSDISSNPPTEMSLGAEPDCRDFSVNILSLMDDNDQKLGSLVMLHDITDEKHSQAQIIEQQQALATLQERERLARELHDNAGQLLGYINMQAQAISKWIQDGKIDIAQAQLTRLANVAQEAHADLRESILNLNVGPSDQWSFLGTLQKHLNTYHYIYGVKTELVIPKEVDVDAIKLGTSVQLMRVIQEALTNARKHGQAQSVCVTFQQQDGRIRIVIADDGTGFKPELVTSSARNHFGLEFMSERMAQIGGSMEIVSGSGSGTQVLLDIPLRS